MTICDVCKTEVETKETTIDICAKGGQNETIHFDLCASCEKFATPNAFLAGMIAVRRAGLRQLAKAAEGQP